MRDNAKREDRECFLTSPQDDYEAQYLARKLGITSAEARAMINAFGDNREALARHIHLSKPASSSEGNSQTWRPRETHGRGETDKRQMSAKL